jgi:hypothetical protein
VRVARRGGGQRDADVSLTASGVTADMRTGTEVTANTPLRLCFVVESGTDVRMVEGLAERCDLTLVTRQVVGGRTISQPTGARFAQETGPSSFLGFAWFTFRRLCASATRTTRFWFRDTALRQWPPTSWPGSSVVQR